MSFSGTAAPSHGKRAGITINVLIAKKARTFVVVKKEEPIDQQARDSCTWSIVRHMQRQAKDQTLLVIDQIPLAIVACPYVMEQCSYVNVIDHESFINVF